MAAPLVIGRRNPNWKLKSKPKINWSDPLTVGLQAFMVPYGSIGIDLINAEVATNLSGVRDFTVTPYGSGVLGTSANNARVLTGKTVTTTNAVATYMLVAQRDSSITGDLRAGIWGATGPNQHGVIILTHASGNVTVANGTLGTLTATAAVADKQWAVIITNGNSGGQDVSVNGFLVGSNSTASLRVATSGFGIGDNETAPFGGAWACAALWGRNLSIGEVTRMSINPFRILADI